MKLENKNLPQLLKLLCNKSEQKKQAATVHALSDKLSEKSPAQKNRLHKKS